MEHNFDFEALYELLKGRNIRALREKLEHGAQSLKATLYLPDLSLCGDNAAMIAAQGFYEYSAKPAAHWDDYALNGVPSLPIDYE